MDSGRCDPRRPAPAPSGPPRVAQRPAAAPAAAAPAAIPAGGVNEEQLGQLVAALGLKPEKQQQRYDFAFRATLDDQEWTLSMSSVLCTDQQSIWIMAWLDELPKNAADVPRNALLRMLATNDAMGERQVLCLHPEQPPLRPPAFDPERRDDAGQVPSAPPGPRQHGRRDLPGLDRLELECQRRRASPSRPTRPPRRSRGAAPTQSAANDPKNTGTIQR